MERLVRGETLFRKKCSHLLQDPRDPLNFTIKRKIVALFFLCFFGAMAAAAELILGAMLPVFALEYAGIDPSAFLKLVDNIGGLPGGADPLKTLSELPGAPPIWKVYLLASLPVLMMGVANLALIPLAIAVGRRSVLLVCGIVAIGGAIWAGNSHSLGSHLAARSVQALGAGTVESLIPFIVQDMVYVHQRNTYMSGIFAAQGIIIIVLGIASPYIIVDQSWRWVYFYTAAFAAVFLVGVYFFLPETKFHRTRAEISKCFAGRDMSSVANNLAQMVFHVKKSTVLSTRLAHGRLMSPSFAARLNGARVGTRSLTPSALSSILRSSSSRC